MLTGLLVLSAHAAPLVARAEPAEPVEPARATSGAVPASDAAPALLPGRDELTRVGRPQRLGILFTDPQVAGGPWRWEIHWGDGTVDTGEVAWQDKIDAEHAYAKPGTWLVRTCVTDADGLTGCGERKITVLE